MKAKRRYLANFEARSVMLIAAWALGSAAAQAKTPSAPRRPGVPMTAPAADMSAHQAEATQDAAAAAVSSRARSMTRR